MRIFANLVNTCVNRSRSGAQLAGLLFAERRQSASVWCGGSARSDALCVVHSQCLGLILAQTKIVLIAAAVDAQNGAHDWHILMRPC